MRKLNVIFLMETLVLASNIDVIKRRLGFEGAFVVDRFRIGGGLAVQWRKNNVSMVVRYALNFIDLEIEYGFYSKWRLTCFYGYPERNRRRES